jgi:hypothetical protein
MGALRMTSQLMKDFPVAVGATLFEGEHALPLQHPALDGPLEERESHWLHHDGFGSGIEIVFCLNG